MDRRIFTICAWHNAVIRGQNLRPADRMNANPGVTAVRAVVFKDQLKFTDLAVLRGAAPGEVIVDVVKAGICETYPLESAETAFAHAVRKDAMKVLFAVR